MGIQPGRKRHLTVPQGGTLLAQFGAGRAIAGSLVLTLLLGLLFITNTVPAFAAATYQITAAWADNTPATVAPGAVVTAEWRVNVNDDAAAPANTPVDNVTVTLTATNGKFAGLPDVCLTTGVTPASSISADGKTMVCNLGTQNMGTAVAIQTPITSDGNTGDNLSVSGTIGGATATLPAVPIVGKFGMDMKWSDSGNWQLDDGSAIHLDYEWTLNLLKGSPAGPNSVSYTVTMDHSLGGAVISEGCGQFTGDTKAGHPWSGAGHPADQTAPFVGSCTFTATATPNVFTMTLTGINYSQAQVPTKDAAGNNLPTDRVAVASGRIQVRIAKPAQGVTVGLSSSAPTYTSAAGGLTSTDDSANNTTRKVWTTAGGWGSAWVPPYSGSAAASYSDTFRAPTGTEIWDRQATALHSGQPASTVIQLCTALDTADVTLSSTPLQTYLLEQPNTLNEEQNRDLANNPFAVSPDGPVNGLTFYYYVGSDPRVTAGSAGYNPAAFTTDCSTDAANWTTTRPADLSTVKAIRTQYAAGSVPSNYAFFVHTPLIINADTAPGTDIWQTSSYKVGAGAWTAPPNVLTNTPGSQYPATTHSRDVMRVASVAPYMEKSVDRASVKPGEPAVYTINYAANGDASAPPTVDGFVVTDTLPVGMTYVAGSSSPAPVVTTNGSGRQVLTWTFNGVAINVLHPLTYQAVAGSNAVPGQTLTNSVTGAFGGLASSPAFASVTVSTNGSTAIGKTADSTYIPNLAGDGSGAGSWTVTLRSYDPAPQSFTDTIDILPYNGDGRGTSYTGSYALTTVTPAAGSTVYYTNVTPGSLTDDPADAANGSAGSVTGNTVGWTTTRPANPTAVRVIGPALAPGATQSFQIGIQTTGATGGDVLVNRAQARAEHTELVMRTSAPITVANFYTASLKKEVRDANGVWHDANDVVDYPTFRIGDSVTYRITATNMGQGTLTNVVVADDQYPAEGGFTIASLAPGASQSHEYTVALGAEVASTFVNTASASADIPADSQVPPTINTDAAGIEVTNYTTVKTSNPASGSTVVSGQTITYTVTVTQSGSAPANASFSDDLTAVLDDADYNNDAVASVGAVNVVGSGLSWNGIVPVGGTATITYSVTVKAAPAGDFQLTNVVRSEGCVPVNGQTTDCTTTHPVSAAPALTLVKSADNSAVGAPTNVGDLITYNFTSQNTGNVTLTGVVIEDQLAGLSALTYTWPGTAGTLLPGQTVTATATYAVTQADINAGHVANTALAKGTDPNGGTTTTPNTSTDTPLSAAPALTLVKSADNSAVGAPTNVGDLITYNFTSQNTGNVTLTGVVIEDQLAGLSALTYAWPGTAGTLLPGQTVTATATYAVTQADINAGHVANTALAKGTDPNGGTTTTPNTSTDTPLSAAPGISLEKSADKTELVAGETITYTFVSTNTGNVTLTGVEISDPLTGLSALTYTWPGTAGTLLPGQTVIATATYAVTQADVDAATVTNTATTTGTPPAGPAVTATDTVQVPANPEPAQSITKTADYSAVGNPARVGDVITYSFSSQNTGNVTLTNVAIADQLAGLSALVYTWPGTAGTLLPGQTVTATATYAITQADIDAGQVINSALPVGETNGGDRPRPPAPALAIVELPPVPVVTVPATTPPATVPPAPLADTGSLANTGAWLLGLPIGLLLLLGGGIFLLAGKRRRHSH